ncbi:MAG: tRNA 4-thiouridine(8) synthase ThiI [Clostridia bacterium]|nr:tRNA 4-thiouridine(8) synthase ThiI [Clostridia bacterium]
MKEILLCKYGEIVLKGANRKSFEDMLGREMKKRASAYGNFDIYRAQSTIYVEPKDDEADMDGMFEAASKVFGIVAIARAAVCEKNMEAISRTAKEYVPQFLAGKKTFKVESKRSDKAFALDSMEISREIGGDILEACPHIRVDVHHPDVIVKVEIREFGAYISAGQFKGAGGMPVGSNGKGLLLLSGGIDSPVAGWMLAKRGVRLDAIHFESFPYTSERAREKVLELAQIVSEYAGDIFVHVVSLTHIQEELVKACEEDYFTLLLRRYMMTIAEKVAREKGCAALITGESLGQVASQTMQALGVTDAAVNLPVFRPCIGMDKEEIVTIARKIGTFETSIQPYEDCCTVFTPRHPRTKPELEKVLVQENKLDFNALVEEAMGTLYTVHIKAEY